jgi:hypothetical protein
MGENKTALGVFVGETLKQIVSLKDLNTDGRIILKQILNEYTFA